MDLSGDARAIKHALVGTHSPLARDKIRVVAGDPAQSYLYQKVSEQRPDFGLRMPPPPNAPLSSTEVAVLRRWIARLSTSPKAP